jgi:hypothetical protein
MIGGAPIVDDSLSCLIKASRSEVGQYKSINMTSGSSQFSRSSKEESPWSVTTSTPAFSSKNRISQRNEEPYPSFARKLRKVLLPGFGL